MWLLFRDVAPAAASNATTDPHSRRVLFDKYVSDDTEGIGWPDVQKSLEALSQLDWTTHRGYRDLCEIMERARCGEDGRPLPPRFADRWHQTTRRIQSGAPWRFSVDPFDECCPAEGCSAQYVSDPRKRQDLRRLVPTICSSCGSVLVPDRLWRAYEELHERDAE